MEKVDHILYGILLGLILPALAWLAIADRVAQIPYLNKPGVVSLIAIALNLLLLRVCYRKGAERAGGGIMLSTFAFLMAVFIFKIRH